ncbi:RAD9, HUS1, RAD1-interacting nuclear orphan protein 1 [Centroberyx gerrardi]
MPRKTSKTQKPPLLFLEPPLRGARLQNVPDVRAALNPKSFTTERQSALDSWVSPQFDQSVVAAPPVRRGRRKCQSATSILDRCSQLSRKNSVCKFPSLSFERRPRDQSHQPKRTHRKKATESSVASGPGDQPQGSRQVSSTVSHPSAQYLDTPKRQLSSVRKRNAGDSGLSDGAASSSRCLDQPEAPSGTGRRRIPAPSASTPPSTEFRTPNVSSVFTPPDVDTPEVLQEESSRPSSPFIHLLLPQPSTPPHNQAPDILVADTPERDYGVKVTWRRRRGLMMMLTERGHLSNSNALIHS